MNATVKPFKVKPPLRPPGKSPVTIDPDEARVTDEVIGCLADADPDLYQRGGMLVRVDQPETAAGAVAGGGSPTIALLPQPSLRELITKHVELVKIVKRGDGYAEVSTHPPTWLVQGIHARGTWPGIRPIAAVSDTPIFRPDGTVLQRPGYDAATGVLFKPTTEFPLVPDDATLDDADAAVAVLLDLVSDFRFEGDEHRAAWVAAVLTPFARHAFDGPTPLFLIDANIRGSGKTLLAGIIGRIVLGRELPPSSYPRDSDELRKRLTAAAMAGERIISFDNITGTFGCDVLDRALTSTTWCDRVLGETRTVEASLTPLWVATGNNVAVAADTGRRMLHVRLDVMSERPEERSGFKYPHLLRHVAANRQMLVAAALTILRAFHNAGRPDQGLQAFGSFEGWSGLVRDALVWCGQPDPAATREQLAEMSDTTADNLGQLLDAWRAYDTLGRGLVATEVLSTLYPGSFPPTDPASVELRSALETIVGAPPGRPPTPRQVGTALRHYRRRVLDGKFIDVDKSAGRRSGCVWRVRSV